ncbi:MAG: biopolymer transporter ExbD [Chlamydiales bacterium]|nr:biopolymer transporter ExbD [Chlamydiales bacterium]
MRKRRAREMLEEAPINLTPLIDVVFVILIMFIVVAPLLEVDRIELAGGPPLKQPARQEQNLIIHVFSDDTITFNKQPVTLPQLEKLLVQARARYPSGHPQLFHDRNARFGTYQSVKSAVESAGFSELDVLLKPQ